MKATWAAAVGLAMVLLLAGCGLAGSDVSTPTTLLLTIPSRPTLGPLPTFGPPPTPVTTTAQIARDEALSIFMAKYPAVKADLEAGRVVTVTASLATHGNRGWPGASAMYHPTLPVWIIIVRFPARTQWFGPAGKEEPFTWDAEGHEMSALDGRIFGSWLIASGKE